MWSNGGMLVYQGHVYTDVFRGHPILKHKLHIFLYVVSLAFKNIDRNAGSYNHCGHSTPNQRWIRRLNINQLSAVVRTLISPAILRHFPTYRLYPYWQADSVALETEARNLITRIQPKFKLPQTKTLAII